MTVDINNYIEVALEGIRDQIEEAHSRMNKIRQAGPGYSQDKLLSTWGSKLLRGSAKRPKGVTS